MCTISQRSVLFLLSSSFLTTNGARGFPACTNFQELPCPTWQQQTDHYHLETESATAAAVKTYRVILSSGIGWDYRLS